MDWKDIGEIALYVYAFKEVPLAIYSTIKTPKDYKQALELYSLVPQEHKEDVSKPNGVKMFLRRGWYPIPLAYNTVRSAFSSKTYETKEPLHYYEQKIESQLKSVLTNSVADYAAPMVVSKKSA